MDAFEKLILGYLSHEGYKKDSPDKERPYNIIPSGDITMKDVEFPVLGQDNLGNKKIMQPGKEYKFPGNYVIEVPLAQQGGQQLDTLFVSNPNDPRLQAYRDSIRLYKEGLQNKIYANDPNGNKHFFWDNPKLGIYERGNNITPFDNWNGNIKNARAAVTWMNKQGSYEQDTNTLKVLNAKIKPIKIAVGSGDSEGWYGLPIYAKPIQPVKYKKPEEPIFNLPPVTVYKPEPPKPLIEKGERTIPDTQYANIKLVYDKNNKLIARMNSKGERIPYDPTGQNLTKEFVYPSKKEGGQHKWFIEDSINVLQSGGQQLFPVPELQSSKQDNTNTSAYLNDIPKSIEERVERDAMIEANRQKKIREKEEGLKKHYKRTDVVSGMNIKPTQSEISQMAQQAVAYNEELEEDPIGVLGPDIALAVMPELLMLKGPQQAISKIGKALNPIKESSPWSQPMNIGQYLTENTILKNTYKLNPYAFKPNSNMLYRGIGKEGLDDAIKSGVFRPRPVELRKIGKDIVTDSGNTFRLKGKTFDKTYWTPRFQVADRYGNGYIAEVPNDIAKFRNRYSTQNEWSMLTEEQIPIVKGRILKKDWLKGYKKVDEQLLKKQSGGTVWNIE